ncbi:uncharacterized protein EDB91DRAFT_1347228 [Suillus paluster]|uniref:uncharacterized protein n=1 Tax=Suillus paluster TaxID=48578 RepID=UPI001B873BBE|nr:uncharacterized protein EDB91DRAFT_1347228 [Suillus paluster]KAG1739865.1 hypothetical protein EDB91DRAFT_1347228 [Suillus paluster]
MRNQICLFSTTLPDDLGVFHVHQVPTPFLPNLNHLVWTHQLGPALVWPLLGPRLQSLHIPSIQWNSKSTPLFLSKIRGLCPELSSLTLQFYLLPACRAATESSISRVICSWKKLEVLDLSPAGSECILSFHVLSSLRVLSLRIDNSFDLDLPANSLSFPLLHTLRFQAISLRTAYSLLQAMRSLPKSVEISLLLHQPGDCGLELILCAIGQHTSCNILEELRMNRDIIVNDFNVLRPLFLCCNLRVLRMTMTPHFVDDDLCAVASAWPQLEILELFGYHIPYMTIPSLDLPTVEELLPIPLPSNRIAKFTFHGLISLLRLCPNLRFFNLTIDATKLDGLQGDKPGGGVCNRLVKRPRLVDSPINDPEAVARILFDILPELETVCGEGFVPDRLGHQPLSPGWARVQEIILASKAARGLAT